MSSLQLFAITNAKRLFIILTSIMLVACEMIERTESPEGDAATPISIPTQPPIPYSTLSASSEYMEGCRRLTQVTLEEQVPLGRILPGSTRKTEVSSLIGYPEQEYSYSDSEWIYNEGPTLVFTKINGVEIVHYAILSGEQYQLTLEEIIMNFGCPDAIFGFRYVFPELAKNYTDLTVIYLKGGIAFVFIDANTLSLKDTPSGVLHFVPGTIEDYFFWHVGLEGVPSMDLDFAKPFDWDDVVGIDKE